jgi:hypothetical protein
MEYNTQLRIIAANIQALKRKAARLQAQGKPTTKAVQKVWQLDAKRRAMFGKTYNPPPFAPEQVCSMALTMHQVWKNI